MQGLVALRIFRYRINVRAMLQQHVHCFRSAEAGGQVQRRPAVAGEGMDCAGIGREDVFKAFDPSLHEALMQSGSGEAEGEAVVGDVLRPGYTLKGHVIRPAGVKVVRR